MYCRILAGGCPCCRIAGRVAAWLVSYWFKWFLLVWSTLITSLDLGSPRNALRTGVSAATTSAWLRFSFRLPSRTLCSTSEICFFSGCSSFCMRWMCSSVMQNNNNNKMRRSQESQQSLTEQELFTARTNLEIIVGYWNAKIHKTWSS